MARERMAHSEKRGSRMDHGCRPTEKLGCRDDRVVRGQDVQPLLADDDTFSRRFVPGVPQPRLTSSSIGEERGEEDDVDGQRRQGRSVGDGRGGPDAHR
jgi:hypothetical protein